MRAVLDAPWCGRRLGVENIISWFNCLDADGRRFGAAGVGGAFFGLTGFDEVGPQVGPERDTGLVGGGILGRGDGGVQAGKHSGSYWFLDRA